MKEDLTFRKMRRRFSLLVMLLIAITLGIIVIVVGVTVYNRTENEISRAVEIESREVGGVPKTGDKEGAQDVPNAFRPDDMLKTKQCSRIVLDEDNNVVKKQGSFELYDNSEISVLVNAFTSVDGDKVHYNGSYYYFKINKTSDGYTIIAYDYTSEREMLIWMLFTSAVIWVLGSAISGAIAYLLSRNVVSPAKEALEKQKELVANASHELKTPITVINADMSIVTADPSATVKDNETWLAAISEQTKRMQTLVQEMLELSRLDSDKMQIDNEAIDLSDLIEVAAMTIEGVAFERNITVDENVEKTSIVSSRALVDKIVYILFDNALKYTDDGGKISVGLTADKKNAVLKISNTGKGIPAEKVPHVFERFYKVDESHSGEVHSFGLGLSMAKQIVMKLNGDIKCESVENVLTTFTVTLPLVPKSRKLFKIRQK